MKHVFIASALVDGRPLFVARKHKAIRRAIENHWGDGAGPRIVWQGKDWNPYLRNVNGVVRPAPYRVEKFGVL